MDRRGLSLLELLVVVAVVGLLLGVAVPSLVGARCNAQSAACLARLGGLARSHQLYAQQSADRWLNPLPPGFVGSIGCSGETCRVVTRVLEGTMNWGLFMGDMAWEPGEHPESIACPAYYDESPTPIYHSPGVGASQSFWYSPAFFTASSLWRDDDPEARQSADLHRRSVSVSEVRHPALKVMLFEPVDRHGKGLRIDNPPLVEQLRSNVVFADGHALRAAPSLAFPALAVRWPAAPPNWPDYFELPDGAALPFSSPAGGYRGRDY